MNSIETLLLDRARALAAHDGHGPVTVTHLHGAANQLQAELLSARDRLIHAPPAPGAEEEAEEVEDPVAAEPAALAVEAAAAPAKRPPRRARPAKAAS